MIPDCGYMHTLLARYNSSFDWVTFAIPTRGWREPMHGWLPSRVAILMGKRFLYHIYIKVHFTAMNVHQTSRYFDRSQHCKSKHEWRLIDLRHHDPVPNTHTHTPFYYSNLHDKLAAALRTRATIPQTCWQRKYIIVATARACSQSTHTRAGTCRCAACTYVARTIACMQFLHTEWGHMRSKQRLIMRTSWPKRRISKTSMRARIHAHARNASQKRNTQNNSMQPMWALYT